jgi:hypothetical protein
LAQNSLDIAKIFCQTKKIQSTSVVKKIDVFSNEKNGKTRHKMALFSALTLALSVGSWAMQG